MRYVRLTEKSSAPTTHIRIRLAKSASGTLPPLLVIELNWYASQATAMETFYSTFDTYSRASLSQRQLTADFYCFPLVSVPV